MYEIKNKKVLNPTVVQMDKLLSLIDTELEKEKHSA